jgi:hypothetical protein
MGISRREASACFLHGQTLCLTDASRYPRRSTSPGAQAAASCAVRDRSPARPLRAWDPAQADDIPIGAAIRVR